MQHLPGGRVPERKRERKAAGINSPREEMTEPYTRVGRAEQTPQEEQRHGETPSKPRVKQEEGDREERRSEQSGHALGRA
ncbi:hypothetical protein NDU88_006375 [Pleurodeles waltl]|uniref:Uncharacterized protein n=1 Tax=Pleurodeles waltl TaxID=8319 RepID=A0AAV7X0H6_PLEWA|nr:hypothetical protein NDU88_006375 [Pleurodeles waltl]